MNLICQFAIQRPGPPVKVWPEQNVVAGIVEHSAEGSLQGAFDVLADVSLTPAGEWNSPKSWHFTIDKDGTTYQHYPLNASCWHVGVHAYNARQIGVEHIGVAGEVLAGAQLAASVRLAQWIAGERGWPQGLLRDVPPGSYDRTLWEHHELNAGTPCPNGRIPWAAYVNAPPIFQRPPPMTQQEWTEATMVALGYVPAGAYQRRYTLGLPAYNTTGERVYPLLIKP